MTQSIHQKYREAFDENPPPTAALGYDGIAILFAKMEQAIKRGEPLTPKDFGMEEWYPGLEDGLLY